MGAERCGDASESKLAVVVLVALSLVGFGHVATLAIWVQGRVHSVGGAGLATLSNGGYGLGLRDWLIGLRAGHGRADGLVLYRVGVADGSSAKIVDGGVRAHDRTLEVSRGIRALAQMSVEGYVRHGSDGGCRRVRVGRSI